MNFNRNSRKSFLLVIILMSLASLLVLGILYVQISSGRWHKGPVSPAESTSCCESDALPA